MKNFLSLIIIILSLNQLSGQENIEFKVDLVKYEYEVRGKLLYILIKNDSLLVIEADDYFGCYTEFEEETVFSKLMDSSDYKSIYKLISLIESRLITATTDTTCYEVNLKNFLSIRINGGYQISSSSEEINNNLFLEFKKEIIKIVRIANENVSEKYKVEFPTLDKLKLDTVVCDY